MLTKTWIQQENAKEMKCYDALFLCLSFVFFFSSLEAIPGVEFGDNKAKKYFTEDNGLAEWIFKECMSKLEFSQSFMFIRPFEYCQVLCPTPQGPNPNETQGDWGYFLINL